jgi:hypothetical protein
LLEGASEAFFGAFQTFLNFLVMGDFLGVYLFQRRRHGLDLMPAIPNPFPIRSRQWHGSDLPALVGLDMLHPGILCRFLFLLRDVQEHLES